MLLSSIMVDERARSVPVVVEPGLFLYISRTILIGTILAAKIVCEVSFTGLAYCLRCGQEQYQGTTRVAILEVKGVRSVSKS
jgi:hypothetical protein